MRILLILPAAAAVRVTREHPEVPRRNMLRFSVLGLTTVAALTPGEHSVQILDENVEPLDLDARADLVGISFMTALAPRAYEIARHFRRRGIPVVGGGYHPTLCPGEALEHCDAIVAGDAEGAWPELLRDLETKQLRRIYRGAAASLSCPLPRRDLLAATRRHYGTIHAVQTTRGCRHQCRYCSVTAFHHQTHRRRPVAEVIAELRTVPRDFIFVDDNIMATPEYARELFRAMIPLRKRWVTQCSIEIAEDPELLSLLRAAGCRGLFIGVETTNAQNLAAMGKDFNRSASYAAKLRKIHGAGIGVVAGLMVGLDADDTSVFEHTLRFLAETAIDGIQVNILTPLPGTPLFRDFAAAGRVTDFDWSKYDFRHVVFTPRRMTAAELQAGGDWLYSQFYRLDRILLRFTRALFHVGWTPAWLALRLGLTYRYDNRREGIRGWNPAVTSGDRQTAKWDASWDWRS